VQVSALLRRGSGTLHDILSVIRGAIGAVRTRAAAVRPPESCGERVVSMYDNLFEPTAQIAQAKGGAQKDEPPPFFRTGLVWSSR
jgi:hypothetical protein